MSLATLQQLDGMSPLRDGFEAPCRSWEGIYTVQAKARGQNPFKRGPQELLNMVIQACKTPYDAASPDSRVPWPLPLAQVDSTWRATALSTKSLWEDISVDVESRYYHLGLVQLLLERAQHCEKLTVMFMCASPGNVVRTENAALALLISSSARWRAASLTIQRSQLDFLHALTRNLPELESLQYHMFSDHPPPFASDIKAFLHAPKLRAVCIANQVDTPVLPLGQLTTLAGTLHSCMSGRMTFPEVLLAHGHHLVELHLLGEFEDNALEKPVNLPNLRTLSVRSAEPLRLLHAENLKELRLEMQYMAERDVHLILQLSVYADITTVDLPTWVYTSAKIDLVRMLLHGCPQVTAVTFRVLSGARHLLQALEDVTFAPQISTICFDVGSLKLSSGSEMWLGVVLARRRAVVDDVRLTALVSCVWRGVMGEAGRDVLRRVVGLTVTYEASSEEWETRMELQSEGFITASELRRTQSV